MADATNTTYPAAKQVFPAIGAGDREDDPGIEHDVMHDLVHATVNALQDVVGTVGEEPPAATVLERLATLESSPGGGSGFAPILPVTTAAHDIHAADAGAYHRFTFSGAKSCTFRPESAEALPASGEWHLRNVSTGNLTLTAGAGVTLNPAYQGSLVLPPGATATVKRAAENVFDVFGVTLAP